MRVAVLGRTKLLYDTVKYFIEKGIEISLIGTCNECEEYSVGKKDFEELAEDKGIRFFSGTNLDDEKLKIIDDSNSDIAISINWAGLIDKKVIDKFKYGILNCHAGDLPKYRGNAVMNWAIINKEGYITLTIHKMDEGLDSGDILMKKKFKVNNNTKIGEVYEWAEKCTPKMFYECVKGIEDGEIIPQKQSSNPNDIYRCYPRIPYDSLIDWNREAEYIDAIIRASSHPFKGAYTYLNGEKLHILNSRVEKCEVPSKYIAGQVLSIDKSSNEVYVGCGKGILIIKSVTYVDNVIKKPTEVIKSLRTRLGMQIEEEVYMLHKKIENLEKIILKNQ